MSDLDRLRARLETIPGMKEKIRAEEFLLLERRVARYFNSAPDEPAGRLISDLLIALRRALD